MAADPDREWYGYDLKFETGIPSGVLYPILNRAAERGLLTSRVERINPVDERRPPRRYYRLTVAGRAFAERATAKLVAHRLTPPPG